MKNFLRGCLLVLPAAIMTGCHGADSSSPAVAETARAQVVESRQQQVPLNLKSTGTVHARESATVSARIMGSVEQVLVREGDDVRAGQPLIVLDDAALRAFAEQAQAGVKAANGARAAAETDAGLAASTLARYRLLQAEKSVSPQELDEVSRRAEVANARLDAARAQAEAALAQEAGARTQLGYARLAAPFSGVVTARMADPGSMAAPGMPLLQLDRAGALQLHSSVDESAIGAVRRGMQVPVSIGESEGPSIRGTVAEIVPAADSASHSFLVKIDLPDASGLRAGMYATARFANGTRQAVLIPRSAVVVRGSLACAYVLDGRQIAQLRYLTLGAARGDLVEALSGISPGEKLVNEPADRDLAGRHIEAQP